MGRLMPVWRRGLLVVAMAVSLLASLPGTAFAASVTFGAGSVTGDFGETLTFRQAVTVTSPLATIELLVRFADAPGPVVYEVDAPRGTGALDLRYDLPSAESGHLLPNTPVAASWRVSTTDDQGALTVGPEARTVVADERFDWRTRAGDVVRVHWYEGGEAFGERALRIGEAAIASSSELLGVTETDPVDFFIYADQGAFYDALGPSTRENVGGQADAEIRTLFALIRPSQIDESWVEIVIPHELTHLVFDTAVDNPYHFPPRWLNEGLAVYESERYGLEDRRLVDSASSNGSLIPLPGLSGQFPTVEDGFRLAYAESVSAVDFLVRTHGEDALVSLIGSYADGRTDDEAFDAALGQDVQAFNDAWMTDLGARTPERRGPQPAPPGPVPSSWQVDPATVPGQPVAASPGSSQAVTVPSPGASAAATPGSGSDDGDGSGIVLPILLGLGVVAVVVIALARRGTGKAAT